jgi:hypothetical protein
LGISTINASINDLTNRLDEQDEFIQITSSGVQYGDDGPKDFYGTGSPEGVVTAPVGSTFRRTDGGAGTSFYVKESGAGNTGWVAK